MKQFQSFALDTVNECLWHRGAQIALAPKPFAVLRYLVENPARLITHDELLDALWPETYVQPQVLRTYMLELRKVLGDDAARPRFIQTLPKRGYCFLAAVTEEATNVAASVAVKVAAPAAVTRRASIAGRHSELGLLAARAELLDTGQRQVVFVTGEAGIGKTALVEAFCQQAAAAQSISIAFGQCVEGLGAKEEYYPVMEALGQLCALPHGEHAGAILARISPAWLSTSRLDRAATTERYAGDRKPGDLCAALEELACERPLLLIFEDVHWADDATLQLISALGRRRCPARLMILATYRPHGIAAEHPLKALKQDLLMRHLCTQIALQPLTREAVRALLLRELQQESLPGGLAGFVYQHSEGNPLFAIAILEHLIAQQFLIAEQADGGRQWKQRAPFDEIDSTVPDGLAQMIELEISRLTPEEQRILEAGSLINVAFPAWAVAAALEKNAGEVEEACDSLAHRLYFLEQAGQDELPDGTTSAFYVFAHGLYREVLYQRQSARCRARGHVRIAERLAQLFSGRAANVAREMAFHYEAAGDWQQAVEALGAAARHAHQRHAHAEAADLLEHTLRIAAHLGEADCASTARDLRNQLTQARAALV